MWDYRETGAWDVLLVLLVLFILFGSRLPGMMRYFGRGPWLRY